MLFPTYQQQQVRMQMAVNLIGVISQTLIKKKDGSGRVAAFETLVGFRRAQPDTRGEDLPDRLADLDGSAARDADA